MGVTVVSSFVVVRQMSQCAFLRKIAHRLFLVSISHQDEMGRTTVVALSVPCSVVSICNLYYCSLLERAKIATSI